MENKLDYNGFQKALDKSKGVHSTPKQIEKHQSKWSHISGEAKKGKVKVRNGKITFIK